MCVRACTPRRTRMCVMLKVYNMHVLSVYIHMCLPYSRTLRSSGADTDMELVKHIKENYIHRVHQAVQVSYTLVK